MDAMFCLMPLCLRQSYCLGCDRFPVQSCLKLMALEGKNLRRHIFHVILIDELNQCIFPSQMAQMALIFLILDPTNDTLRS